MCFSFFDSQSRFSFWSVQHVSVALQLLRFSNLRLEIPKSRKAKRATVSTMARDYIGRRARSQDRARECSPLAFFSTEETWRKPQGKRKNWEYKVVRHKTSHAKEVRRWLEVPCRNGRNCEHRWTEGRHACWFQHFQQAYEWEVISIHFTLSDATAAATENPDEISSRIPIPTPFLDAGQSDKFRRDLFASQLGEFEIV